MHTRRGREKEGEGKGKQQLSGVERENRYIDIQGHEITLTIIFSTIARVSPSSS
jgi:hypothetical protein